MGRLHDDRISPSLLTLVDTDHVQVGSSLCLLVLLSHPDFLRTHQALVVLSACSIQRHLLSDSLFPRTYIYISARLFLYTSVVQCVDVLQRNGNFRHDRARALVTHAEGSVKIKVTLSRALKVEAGYKKSMSIYGDYCNGVWACVTGNK